MYFPVLRGKQYDLIALREISGTPSVIEKVHPVIEPVKDQYSSLDKTLEVLHKAGMNFTVILNPQKGNFTSNPGGIIEWFKEEWTRIRSGKIGLILRSDADMQNYIDVIEEAPITSKFLLFHEGKLNRPEDLVSAFQNRSKQIAHNIFDESMIKPSRYKDLIQRGTEIKFTDPFPKELRNSDYPENARFFSDDNLFFKEDGFQGFSDFATIGEGYSETGFTPKVITIHLTYINPEDNTIWIRHFKSDDGTFLDLGGKYEQAVRKLVRFCDQNEIQSIAIDEFRKHLSEGKFPGLGSVKKLSIMHHIITLSQSF